MDPSPVVKVSEVLWTLHFDDRIEKCVSECLAACAKFPVNDQPADDPRELKISLIMNKSFDALYQLDMFDRVAYQLKTKHGDLGPKDPQIEAEIRLAWEEFSGTAQNCLFRRVSSSVGQTAGHHFALCPIKMREYNKDCTNLFKSVPGIGVPVRPKTDKYQRAFNGAYIGGRLKVVWELWKANREAIKAIYGTKPMVSTNESETIDCDAMSKLTI